MTTRARSAVVAAVTLVTVLGGVTVPATAAPPPVARSAPAAHPGRAPAHPSVEAVVCTETVALGTTSECDLGTGDAARYTVAVPAADTLRYRVEVPSAFVDRTMTLRDDHGATVCSDSGAGIRECAVPAGTFTLEVTAATGSAAPVHTSIDGVLAASCAPTTDLDVGGPGTTLHIEAPGASDCAVLDATAGDLLSFTLDADGDQGVDVRIYDSNGAQRCHVADVTPFSRTTCIPSGGSGFRLFASPTDEYPQTVVLFATRLSHPSGCATGPLDAFGVPATRAPQLAPHQAVCFDLGSATGVGVSVLASGVSVGTVAWSVYDAAGQVTCGGVHADVLHPLTACVLNDSPSHALVVTTQSRTPVDLVVSLVETSAGTGCRALTSTAWDAAATTGRLRAGAVGCHTFVASAGDVVRPVVADPDLVADGLLLDAGGHRVCDFFTTAECTVHTNGTYRALVSKPAQGQLAYRLWAINTSTTAGCTPIEPDPFGVAPTHDAQFTAANLAVCYSVAAPRNSAYYQRAVAVSGALSGITTQLRSVDAFDVCTRRVCAVGEAGTRLLVVTRPVGGQADPEGTVRAGVHRVDVLASDRSCPSASTSFDAVPAAGAITSIGEVDCHRFTSAGDDVVAFRATRKEFPDPIDHEIYDADGNFQCFAADTMCVLTGRGPYRVLTSSRSYPFTGRYRFTVGSVTRPGQGCRTLAELPFGVAPREAFALGDKAGMRCYRIDRTSSDGWIAPRIATDQPDAGLRVGVFGPDFTRVCTAVTDLGSCFAGASGRYTLIVYTERPGAGSIGWYDLSHSAGCRAGPDLSFGTRPSPMRVAGPGAVACVTVPAAPGDTVLTAFGSGPSGTSARAQVVQGNGGPPCGTFRDDYAGPAICALPGRADGPFRILVRTSGRSDAVGTYRMHAWRTNHAVGCTDIGSLDGGFGPLVGTLSDPNELDCYRGSTRGGSLSVTTSNDDVAADVPRVQFVRPSAAVQCAVLGTGTCVLPRGDYSILVGRNFGRPVFSGHYRITGTPALR